jgi:hypothetical protein
VQSARQRDALPEAFEHADAPRHGLEPHALDRELDRLAQPRRPSGAPPMKRERSTVWSA